MTKLTKEDLPFLVSAMESKIESLDPTIGQNLLMALKSEEKDESEPTKISKIKGSMDIPEPVSVNVNGGMSVEDYKTCSLVMSICQNMVQQQIITSAQEMGIKSSKALQNMDAWVEAYIAFPFPFFNFKDMQSNEYKNENFSITTDPDGVDSILNIKDVPDLKKAVIGALQKSGGDVFGKNKQSQYFKYFGIITVYDENALSIRFVKYDMNLEIYIQKQLI